MHGTPRVCQIASEACPPGREYLLPGHSDAHTLFGSDVEILIAEIDPHPVDFAVEDAVLDIVVIRG